MFISIFYILRGTKSPFDPPKELFQGRVIFDTG